MTTEELEPILEGSTETQRIDFKESCGWHLEIFAKDILSLANVRGGGYIIIGVRENDEGQKKFERVGISETHRKTYDIDIMKDAMSRFADPCVDFTTDFPRDKDGKTYAVIYVYEFEEVPIICKSDSGNTTKGTIYYRNRGRRWESAPISNSYDLKDIIDRAAVKMMRKYKGLGLSTVSSVPDSQNLFDDEIKDLL